MIKIKYEIYHNDYNRRFEEKSFTYMSEFKDWMFGSMNRPYVDSDGYKNMYFLDDAVRLNRKIRAGDEIRFKPDYHGAHYWVHSVSDNNNIVFSNGKYTNGQCYISEGFKAFMKECQDKRDGKTQDFIFGEINGFKATTAKTPSEQAKEFIDANPSVAREIFSIIDKEHQREDIYGKLEDEALGWLPAPLIDNLVSSFESALSKNVSYFDVYWAIADCVIEEFVKEKTEKIVEEWLNKYRSSGFAAVTDLDIESDEHKGMMALVEKYCSCEFQELHDAVFGANAGVGDLIFRNRNNSEEYELYYYNPDSVAGGQIVNCPFAIEDAPNLIDNSDYFDVLAGHVQYLSDVDTEHFFNTIFDLIEKKKDGLYLGNDVNEVCREIIAKDKQSIDSLISDAAERSNQAIDNNESNEEISIE